MIDLTSHIEYLATGHDHVVIPGVGTIMASMSESYSNPENFQFIPPRRELAFNVLTPSDCLLVASVARREGVSLDAASSMVAEATTLMADTLAMGQSVSLGRLGTLHRDAEQKSAIIFEPGETANAKSQSPGYTDFTCLTLEALEEAERPIIATVKRYNPLRSIAAAAASIAIILMIGVMFVNPVVDSSALMASLTPMFQSKTEPVAIEDLCPTIELAIAIPDPDEATAEVAPILVSQDSAPTYILVVASLPTLDKANEYIADMSMTGEHFNVILSGNRYRVYIDSGDSMADVTSRLNAGNRSATFPDAWVTRP